MLRSINEKNKLAWSSPNTLFVYNARVNNVFIILLKYKMEMKIV